MNYENIILKKTNSLGIITLNRIDALNALNIKLLEELDNAINNLEEDTNINVIIITGEGNKAFSSGADIKEMVDLSSKIDPNSIDRLRQKYYLKLIQCSKPTIGLINGLAYGGGAILATCLDIRIGCEKTKFKFSASSHGKLHGTWCLSSQIGLPLAKELLFSAREVESEEAHKIGLLNHIVPYSNLKNKGIELAYQISNNYPEIVQNMKKIMLENIGKTLINMYKHEINIRENCLDSIPIEEGFKTFLNKKDD